MELRVRRRWLKLAESMVTAGGRQRIAEVLEVELHDAGLTGFGEAAAVGAGAASGARALRFLEDCATRAAIADAIEAPKFPHQRLERLGGNLAARAALSAALHDLWGKDRGIPIWRLLAVPRIGPCTTWTIPLASPADMANAAQTAPPQFRRLKLKLGGRDGRDGERVARVREATPLSLQVDVNGGWRFEEAVENLRRLEAAGVELCEQPLPPGDPAARELKHWSPIPLYADEECQTLGDVASCAGRADGINVKLAKCGGIGAAVEMISAARDAGLGVMVGCMAESTLGIAAAAQIAGLCDHVDLDANLRLARDPWQGLALHEGAQVPADAPGLGVERIVFGRAERIAETATGAYHGSLRPVLRHTYALVRQRRS